MAKILLLKLRFYFFLPHIHQNLSILSNGTDFKVLYLLKTFFANFVQQFTQIRNLLF